MRSDFSLNKSAIGLSDANPARGHREVRRSTGHIMVTTSRDWGMPWYEFMEIPKSPSRFLRVRRK